MNAKEIAAFLRGKGFEHLIEGHWAICATTFDRLIMVSASFRPGLSPSMSDFDFPWEVVRELAGEITPETQIEHDGPMTIWKWWWIDPSIRTSMDKKTDQAKAIAEVFNELPEQKPKPLN